MNVGQAEIAAAVTVRQALVVEPQQVQQRRVQVVNVDPAFLDERAERASVTPCDVAAA